MDFLPPTAQEESPPQVIGEFKPVDEWQVHLNAIFYGLRGERIRDYYQTMASADFRLAHALAVEFFEAHHARQELPDTVVIHEWGCGNGNLAACFLSHLKTLDPAGNLYRKIRYVLVDNNLEILQSALAHPDLQRHRERVSSLQADVQDLGAVKDATVHWIVCNELWNDLRTKVMLRKEGEIIEELVRPNLSDAKSKEFPDWFAFVRDFQAGDVSRLREHPAFLDEIIWEKDYGSVDWKRVPYRKILTELLKQIEELVIIPINLGALETMNEARRVLVRCGRFSSFDAGAPALETLASPDKPCYGLHGGQYSFIVNFALCEAVARHLGITEVTIEPQRDFVSRMLGHNLLTVVDLLETYPSPRRLRPWERDRLILKTLHVLSSVSESPYRRRIDYPFHPETPEPVRREMLALLEQLPPNSVPDTIAYLTEEEVLKALPALTGLGFESERIEQALRASARNVDDIGYYRFSCVL